VVKICDFGVSKLLENADSKATECSGTPAYMAPEVVLCEAVPEVTKNKKKPSKKAIV
jgi:serine/threonine protein kinase